MILFVDNRVQDDQLNMAVRFWYLWESDMSGLHMYNGVHWTSHFLQGFIKTQPCLTGHPVCVDNWLGPDSQINLLKIAWCAGYCYSCNSRTIVYWSIYLPSSNIFRIIPPPQKKTKESFSGIYIRIFKIIENNCTWHVYYIVLLNSRRNISRAVIQYPSSNDIMYPI